MDLPFSSNSIRCGRSVRTYERDPNDGLEYPRYRWCPFSAEGKQVTKVGQDGEDLRPVIQRLVVELRDH